METFSRSNVNLNLWSLSIISKGNKYRCRLTCMKVWHLLSSPSPGDTWAGGASSTRGPEPRGGGSTRGPGPVTLHTWAQITWINLCLCCVSEPWSCNSEPGYLTSPVAAGEGAGCRGVLCHEERGGARCRGEVVFTRLPGVIWAQSCKIREVYAYWIFFPWMSEIIIYTKTELG